MGSMKHTSHLSDRVNVRWASSSNRMRSTRGVHQMDIAGMVGRRSVLKAGAVLGGLSAVLARAGMAPAEERSKSADGEITSDEVRITEIPFSATAKITVERRRQIVL